LIFFMVTHSQPHESIIPDLQMHYLQSGSGHPVVFLHGWAAFKEIWWQTLEALAPYYHGIAFEWPGHGRSPARSEVTSLTDLAELVAQGCSKLGLRQVTVVGHSMGGRIAALLALAYPELVSRVVLANAALDPTHLARYGRRMLQMKELERTLALHRRLGRGLGRWLSPADHRHSGGFVRPFLRRAYYQGLADPATLHRYLTALYAESLDQHLPEIHQPTLVLTGEYDPLVSPRQACLAAERIPNARLHIIPRTLHTPMDDRPHEFNRVLLQFLRTTPPTYAKPRA
jgi:3-oxoadipate enol-lactonase